MPGDPVVDGRVASAVDDSAAGLAAGVAGCDGVDMGRSRARGGRKNGFAKRRRETWPWFTRTTVHVWYRTSVRGRARREEN